jgi:DnaJ-domain-containing protein 1
MSDGADSTDRKHLDAGAELCGIVGSPDLLAWLGLAPEADEATALEALRARRRRMQGMQANPKFRDEALFLIKHFQAIQDAVADRAAHLEDMRLRHVQAQLPALDATIRGALAGKTALTRDQQAFLHHNATELGIDDATFERELDKICAEYGVPRPGAPPPVEVPTPAAQHLVNHYAVLGVSAGASVDEVRAAYKEGMVRVRRHPDATVRQVLALQMDLAVRVLSDPVTRSSFDASPIVAASVTGAPARSRMMAPDTTGRSRRTTVPPYDLLLSGHGLPARIELVGDATRIIRLNDAAREIVVAVRNAGDQPMAGRVSATVPWLVPNHREIDPVAKLQDVRFRLLAELASDEDVGLVVVDCGEAGRAEVRFQAHRPPTMRQWGSTVLWVSLPLLAAALLSAAALAWRELAPRPAPQAVAVPVARPWLVRIDPAASEVRVNGVFAGRGANVAVHGLSDGPVRLMVLQPNFETYDSVVDARAGGTFDVVLRQLRRLDQAIDEGAIRAVVPAREADPALSQVTGGMEACARERAAPGGLVTGTVHIHVGRDGVPFGLDVGGDQAGDISLRSCIERLAAGVSLTPLPAGDYATLRWDYAVTGRAR